MPALETTYYIVGIVFMGLMLLITVIGVVAVLVIRNKLVAIHKRVEERLNTVSEWAERGEAVADAINGVRRAVKK